MFFRVVEIVKQVQMLVKQIKESWFCSNIHKLYPTKNNCANSLIYFNAIQINEPFGHRTVSSWYVDRCTQSTTTYNC
jgi:hypothetical protein